MLLREPAFMLADEVGAGKSKQIVDTDQILYQARFIDTTLVIAPAGARGVWANPHPALGEVAKHGWDTVKNVTREYSVNHKDALKLSIDPSALLWMVSNYEFIRRDERLPELLKWAANRKFHLVCDEAWMLKDYGTDQWKAVHKLRRLAQRVTLLNGTPIADTPLDLFAQMFMLDKSILGYKWFSHFRARYAILKPNVTFPMIIGWQNLEELRAKVAPYVLRRETRDCFDLPEILDPVLVEVPLTEGSTWKYYKQMRDDMLVFLDSGEASVAKQAIVKGMRLAQITSGFLGGIQVMDLEEGTMIASEDPPKEIGREKLDGLLKWLKQQGRQSNRIIIWARFRAEIERTAAAFNELAPDHPLARRMYLLYGGQSKADRDAAVRAMNPETVPEENCGVVGSAQAGGAAVNLAGADLMINISRDFNLRAHLQSRGRIDRPGQRNPIRYVDIVATGPKGQRTIDHHILAALREKEDVARWTTATWKRKLLEE